MENTAEQVVCFTGHRMIRREDALALPGLLEQQIRRLYADGVRQFRTGGAQGFDTVAALKILELREEYPDMRLCLFLPFPGQEARWSEAAKRTYRYVLDRADEVHYVREHYTKLCFFERNRQLVQGSGFCIAYCVSNESGTGYTFRQALREGLTVLNLYDLLPRSGAAEQGL
ncbi:uncharacterized protein BN660_00422 [Clostridium sp. CAG:448]|nr:uncharacterized protein BN660_00422 [Clostridium sp. CAG:448]